MKYLSLFIALLSLNSMSQMLDKDSFVQRLIEFHPFFAQQELTSKIKQIEATSASTIDEWTVGINTHLKNETDSVSNLYDDLNTHTLNISASKVFADTGASVILSQAWTENTKDNVGSSNKKFSVDYSLPLWRNVDGINNTMDSDVAYIERAIDRLDKKEKKEQFILEKLKKFVDLSYAQEQKSINEEHLVLAAQELELTQKKYEASIVDRVDVLLQEDAFLRAKQQLLQSEQELTLLQHEIAILLDIDFSELLVSFDLYEQNSFHIDDLKSHIFEDSRIAKIANLNESILKRQLVSLKNKSRPELDLKLGLSSESDGTTYLNVLQGLNPAFSIGVELTYQLGNTRGLSSIAINQVSIDRLEQQKQEQLLSIYSQAMVLKKKVILLAEMSISNRNQIEIARQRTTEERKRYSNGYGQASAVIKSQNNEQNAILNLAKTAKNYQRTVLDYQAIVDNLLP